MMRSLGFAVALAFCLALPATGWADKPEDKGKPDKVEKEKGAKPEKVKKTKKGPLDDVTCELVSYDAPASRLTVKLANLPAKKKLYGAAALDKGEEGGVWVQVGQDVKADGEYAFEASDFHGKAYVYLAKNPAGKTFLKKAQKGSAKAKPAKAKLVQRAAIAPVCSFDLP